MVNGWLVRQLLVPMIISMLTLSIFCFSMDCFMALDQAFYGATSALLLSETNRRPANCEQLSELLQ